MVSKKNRTELRQKKHYRLRHTLSGTSERPRLAVFRSNKHMYAQVIDDTKGVTLCSASTLDREVKDGLTYTDNMEAAQKLGTVLGERAKAKGIEAVVFDRGGHLYAGKIQAFADSAREAGLKF